jgi:hypothetical protein
VVGRAKGVIVRDVGEKGPGDDHTNEEREVDGNARDVHATEAVGEEIQFIWEEQETTVADL